MSGDELATPQVNDIDPRLLEFIRTKVNTFVKWDIVRFFHDNPQTVDTAESLARYIGRDLYTVENELQELIDVDIIEQIIVEHLILFRYAAQDETHTLIRQFLKACENREFRVKAIYYVIRGRS